MPELKLYTVADLRAWLLDGQRVNGLDEKVISTSRAWAFLHNPYVQEADAVVAAIVEDGELAAYSASFPDWLNGQRIWWCSTLYCYPNYIGRGYGMIVLGSLMESHQPELTFDRWGAPETVEICSHLGLKTTYTQRYVLSDRAINQDSFKGRLAYSKQTLQKRLHRSHYSCGFDYSLRYATYIDGEAYAFMSAHQGSDLWLREQQMLNWILCYPFSQACVLHEKVADDAVFTGNSIEYGYCVVKVYVDQTLVGVYVLRRANGSLAVVFLYFEHDSREVVFDSIVAHVKTIHPTSFVTENKELYDFVKNQLWYPKCREESISLSLPYDVFPNTTFTLQLGDGDSFA